MRWSNPPPFLLLSFCRMTLLLSQVLLIIAMISPILPHSSSPSSSPPKPTLIHESVIVFSSPSITDIGRAENSPEDVVGPSPLIPRTLLSHPNYQTDAPGRLRPLAEIENIAPSSLFSYNPPTLTRAHLIHTILNSSLIISSPPLESATPSSSSNLITADFFPNDPFTYHKALQSHDAAHWVHAMTNEIHSLKENKTWELVHLLDGCKTIICKRVFKTKYLPNGNVDKFKTRLVAQGCTQKVGIDYSETFSLMVKFESARIVMAITIADDLKIIHFDIKKNFYMATLLKSFTWNNLKALSTTTRKNGYVPTKFQQNFVNAELLIRNNLNTNILIEALVKWPSYTSIHDIN